MVTIRIQEEGWTPLSITKSGWSVKTRPIYSYMRWTGAESVGSDIKWCNSDDIVSNSIWLPVRDVISTHHHALDLALKSPKSIEKWALLHFRTPPLLLLMTLMKKRGWKLYRSPNPNPRGVRKCNSAEKWLLMILMTGWSGINVFQSLEESQVCTEKSNEFLSAINLIFKF